MENVIARSFGDEAIPIRRKTGLLRCARNDVYRDGFTLIELSIVLVIIGLIVGGILVGQDLIKGAQVRAQISQIEKLNQAVNTFRGKYGGLPGDLAVSTASQFAFPSAGTNGCTGTQGGRDGNGLIEGAIAPNNTNQNEGETALFWQDLLASSLYTAAPANGFSCNPGSTPWTTTNPGLYLPVGILGNQYLYVYSNNGVNYFGLSQVTALWAYGSMSSSATIPVVKAYAIDAKIDDGLPITGTVQAATFDVTSSSAATDTKTTCYNTTSNAYSISSLANYGAGGNCALSFRFQ